MPHDHRIGAGTMGRHRADLLVQGFGLACPIGEPVPPGTRCAMTGVPLTYGVPKAAIVSAATADLADTFRVPSAWVSPAVAAAFGTKLTGNLLVADGVGIRPVIARTSATPARPCWSGWVQTVPGGTEVLCIVSTEAQKRTWPAARVSRVGNGWTWLLQDGPDRRLCVTGAAFLRGVLETVEIIYSAGFTKAAIGSTLLAPAALATVRAVGFAQATAWESDLRTFRASDAFAIALVIAQKTEAVPIVAPPAPAPISPERTHQPCLPMF